jgi:Nif-specific regulatory protein
VLLRGESGTGKELVARAIHASSARAGKNFVAVNCAAIPPSLFESELFGHERGAFTGAVARKIGKLEAAQGSTIFLDEIGELAPDLQVKLLRVLQEREFERVGGTTSIKLDIRLIAATNIDLKAAIQDNRFREDLFFRLDVFSLEMPPLRERREDIPLVAAYFVTKFSEKANRRIKGIAAAARNCLMHYDWPGNVRELENAIERAVGYCSADFIFPEDLPDNIAEAGLRNVPRAQTETHALNHSMETEPIVIAGTLLYRDAVREARKQIVLHAFEQAGGNHNEAAKLLGLHPNNLHRVTNELGLKPQLKKTP